LNLLTRNRCGGAARGSSEVGRRFELRRNRRGITMSTTANRDSRFATRSDRVARMLARCAPVRHNRGCARPKGERCHHVWIRTQSTGGCQPALIHSRRTRTAMSLLSCSAATVARPEAVRPTIREPSSLQEKCRLQRWRRGLKSLTWRPELGSPPGSGSP
jgi:hypothetical protein